MCTPHPESPPNQIFQQTPLNPHSPNLWRFFIGCQDASSQEFTIGFLPRSSCIDFRHHHFTGNWKKGKRYAHDLKERQHVNNGFFSGHQKKWNQGTGELN